MNKSLEAIFPAPPEGLSLAELDVASIPEHIAVIMDGNGRWAKKRMMNRLRGHKAGIEAVRETIRAASDLGVRYLTMLAEVDGLDEEGVRVMTIGDMSVLPADTRAAFEAAWEQTRDNDGMTLVVAVNYGSRSEIVRAAKLLAAEAADAASAFDIQDIDEDALARRLYTADIPDPDVIIRTSGEMRLSNFLLWQAAYAELVCTDTLWPDFDRYELLRCILAFQGRSRRFGGV